MIERPANIAVFGNFYSDGRNSLVFNGNWQLQWEDYDGFTFNGRIGMRIRPSSRWSLTVGPRLMKVTVPAQYITTVADPTFSATYDRGYIFAQLDQTEVALETRFDFTFRPGLTLETYVQPLVSAGNYGQPEYLETPGSFNFAEYDALGFNPDFNIRSLRGNAVLRWEWMPGSNIYLAWQQRRFDYGTFDSVGPTVGEFSFDRDVRAVFNTPADNIFLIKVSYWLSP